RRTPFLELTPPQIERLIGERVSAVQPLAGGARNTNYRIVLADALEPLVLRIYSSDASAALREPAVLRLIADAVPAPRIIRAEPHARPPWSLMTFVDAERFDLYITHASADDVGSVAFTAGEALAAIHAFRFEKSGYFDAALN